MHPDKLPLTSRNKNFSRT